jgi:hypothetical protein
LLLGDGVGLVLALAILPVRTYREWNCARGYSDPDTLEACDRLTVAQ